jgi:hypothetical protein
MPQDSIDDNFEHAHAEWLQRLQGRKITRDEATCVLQVMKARLEFLHELHSRIADHGEFSEQARDVRQEIESQAEEIEKVQRFIDEG